MLIIKSEPYKEATTNLNNHPDKNYNHTEAAAKERISQANLDKNNTLKIKQNFSLNNKKVKAVLPLAIENKTRKG